MNIEKFETRHGTEETFRKRSTSSLYLLHLLPPPEWEERVINMVAGFRQSILLVGVLPCTICSSNPVVNMMVADFRQNNLFALAVYPSSSCSALVAAFLCTYFIV